MDHSGMTLEDLQDELMQGYQEKEEAEAERKRQEQERFEEYLRYLAEFTEATYGQSLVEGLRQLLIKETEQKPWPTQEFTGWFGRLNERELRMIERARDYAFDPYGEPNHLFWMVIAHLADLLDEYQGEE